MTINNNAIDGIKEDVKAFFDTNFTYVAFGTGTTEVSSASTTLEGEFTRVARQDYSKATNSVTISTFLSSTVGNGNDIKKVASFDASSSGNILSEFKLATAISKTSDKEVWIDQTFTINVSEE